MKTRLILLLSLLTAGACLPALAQRAGALRVSDARGAAPLAAQAAVPVVQVVQEEIQQAEAVVGRRLSPAELAELRRQIRQQWVPRQDLIRSAETQPAERVVPMPAHAPGTAGTLADSVRPLRP